MNIIGGWGGVKITLAIDEVEQYSVVFERRNGYCTQPDISPEGWSGKTINGKTLQKIDGYRLTFRGLFENVKLGDELELNKLMKMISRSQRTGVSMTLYPKWNESIPECASYSVRCKDEWSAADINSKAKVGQRIKELVFESAERVDEPPYFLEGEYVYMLAVGENTALSVGENTALKIRK